jgi:hypothetical protein
VTNLFFGLARSRRSPEGTARSGQVKGTTGIGEVDRRRATPPCFFAVLIDTTPARALVASKSIGFIETMDCLPVSMLPEDPEWTYEIKLDGYRLEAVRNEKEVKLYSLRGYVLKDRFGYIATALGYLPVGTVVDGEVVALASNGHAASIFCRRFDRRSLGSSTTSLTSWFMRIAT